MEPADAMTNVQPLGRVVSVDPRSVWRHEAHDFTPWLLDNVDVLANALGIDIELESAEQRVGGFLLDLIGKDLSNDVRLIVENQLAGTDHGHLGQILTYAAGTDAETIVWIATEFREEHRQALTWLNEQTAENIHFFGVQLELIRIGDSQSAPFLRLVVEPNDWQKQVRAVSRTSEVGPKGQAYIEFWTRYLERVRLEHPGWTNARKPGPANWMSQSIQISGVWITVGFAQGARLRHELYIDSGDSDRNTEIFEHLASQAEDMQQAYGRPLTFEPLAGRQACRIADYTSGDVLDSTRHDEFIDWFFDAGVRLRRALSEVSASP